MILEGELGAGKTFFTRALARALGVPQETPVTSPTFMLLQELLGRVAIVHGDLYRLGDASELEELGLADATATSVVVLEWAARFLKELGGDALVLQFEMGEGDSRTVTLRATGPRSAVLLAAISLPA